MSLRTFFCLLATSAYDCGLSCLVKGGLREGFWLQGKPLGGSRIAAIVALRRGGVASLFLASLEATPVSSDATNGARPTLGLTRATIAVD